MWNYLSPRWLAADPGTATRLVVAKPHLQHHLNVDLCDVFILMVGVVAPWAMFSGEVIVWGLVTLGSKELPKFV